MYWIESREFIFSGKLFKCAKIFHILIECFYTFLKAKKYRFLKAVDIFKNMIIIKRTGRRLSLQNTHRKNWKNSKKKLTWLVKKMSRHYLNTTLWKNHTDIQNIGLESAYKIMFLVQPEFKNLDYKESVWIKILNAKINLNKTVYEDLIF